MDKDFVKLPLGNNANPILFWKAKASSLHFTISSIYKEIQKRVLREVEAAPFYAPLRTPYIADSR